MLRNRLLAASVVQRMLLRGTKSLATDADLPDYPDRGRTDQRPPMDMDPQQLGPGTRVPDVTADQSGRRRVCAEHLLTVLWRLYGTDSDVRALCDRLRFIDTTGSRSPERSRGGTARRPSPLCGEPPQDRNLSRAASIVPLSGEAYDFMVILLYEMKLGHRFAGALTVPPSPIFSPVFAA